MKLSSARRAWGATYQDRPNYFSVFCLPVFMPQVIIIFLNTKYGVHNMEASISPDFRSPSSVSLPLYDEDIAQTVSASSATHLFPTTEHTYSPLSQSVQEQAERLGHLLAVICAPQCQAPSQESESFPLALLYTGPPHSALRQVSPRAISSTISIPTTISRDITDSRIESLIQKKIGQLVEKKDENVSEGTVNIQRLLESQEEEFYKLKESFSPDLEEAINKAGHKVCSHIDLEYTTQAKEFLTKKISHKVPGWIGEWVAETVQPLVNISTQDKDQKLEVVLLEEVFKGMLLDQLSSLRSGSRPLLELFEILLSDSLAPLKAQLEELLEELSNPYEGLKEYLLLREDGFLCHTRYLSGELEAHMGRVEK